MPPLCDSRVRQGHIHTEHATLSTPGSWRQLKSKKPKVTLSFLQGAVYKFMKHSETRLELNALTTIDNDTSTSAMGTGTRGKEHSDTTNVLWCADTASWLDAFEQVTVLLETVSSHTRREDTGADGVDHDVLFGERVGEHLGEVQRGCL